MFSLFNPKTGREHDEVAEEQADMHRQINGFSQTKCNEVQKDMLSEEDTQAQQLRLGGTGGYELPLDCSLMAPI